MRIRSPWQKQEFVAQGDTFLPEYAPKMKALVLAEPKSPVVLQEVEKPIATPGSVIVKIHAAALNRRDYWITEGLYPGITTPTVLGSDGSGTVHEIGDKVTGWAPDTPVAIYPGSHWGPDPSAQSVDFSVLGMPEDGTFAEYIKVSSEQLFPKPSHLSWEETATIPVAGITAYRALKVQGRLQSGQRVLITGIGGGVAVFALQLAVASGAEVIVTSSSPEKIQRARDLGARSGYDYQEDNWAKQLAKDHGPCDLVIDGAGGKGYADLIGILKPGGRLVNYGSTTGRPENLDLFKVFWRQLHLIGTSLGSSQDFQALLTFLEEKAIKPIIDQVVPLEDGSQAIAAMAKSTQFGKVALNVAECTDR